MHAAAALPDGRVVFFGGRGCLGDQNNGPDASNPITEILDVKTMTWSVAAPMVLGVDRLAAVTLQDGRVLAAGGQVTYGACASRVHYSVPAAQIFDPASEQWSPARPLNGARAGHTLTLLADGRVLAAGGGAQTAELFDPAAGTWSSANQMPFKVSSHTATLLPDGRVLIAGGIVGSTSWPGCVLWDPQSKQWNETGTLNESRADQAAVLLHDGRVLVAGGEGDGGDTIASAEIFDPASETWTETAPMNEPRGDFVAAVLPDGRVLASGGYTITDGFFSQPRTSEIYDPAMETWSDAGNLAFPHEDMAFAQTTGGRIVVAGGGYEGEGYTGAAEIFTP